MSHPISYFITKLTAPPVQWLFFRRKTYYEDRNEKNRFLKGGVLYVSNHKSFWDYICYFFLVYFHKLRPVVSDLIYRKNPVLRFLLNMCGAIVVGKNELDLSFVERCVELLRKGKKIVIFPEAHFIHDGNIRDFSPSFAKIALEADVPIVPLYIDGNYSFFHRTRVMVGKKIYPDDICASSNNEEVEKLRETVQDKVIYLQDICSRRSKTPLFSFPFFMMDFGRINAKWLFAPIFRTKVHFDKSVKPYGIKREGPIILACNHRYFLDSVVIINAFWRRRLWILIAKEIYGEEGKHRLRKSLLKSGGGIKIDREAMDIEAIKKCCDTLEKGRALLVFPEGHLTHDGDLSPLKDGVSMISSRTTTPILPLYICTAKKLTSKRHLYVGDLIPPSGKGMAEIKKGSETINEKLHGLRELALKEGNEHE
ncbi:MAG: 1-acyl-sn-glycerol-3-phosphate acyltransferase [Bacilli bacterium]|nr:1-acyl-sn-glycerol-3-phosphate acyltransferase [Bacilli bacterium]